MDNSVKEAVVTLGKKAKIAEYTLMTAGTNTKNSALESIASALEKNTSYIIEKNKADIEAA